MTARNLVFGIALAALLSACTSSQAQQRKRQGREAASVLDRLDTIGDPGRVVAADIAFARKARDEGQWTASREYAATGALLHGRDGTIPAASFLAELADPAEAVAWSPTAVWSSCDGTLAVSFGRFQDPEGLLGSYVTAWDLQSDRGYKWSYEMAAPDNPQPAPRTAPDIPEDAIIVPGMTAIDGRVADCARGGPIALPAEAELADNVKSRTRQSDDWTLQYRWEHHADGTRRVVVDWLRNGVWEQALDFTVPPDPASAPSPQGQ